MGSGRLPTPLRFAALIDEGELVAGGADRHVADVFQRAEEHLIGQRVSDFLLHDTRERARAELRVVAVDRPATHASGVSVMATCRSRSCSSSCSTNFFTISFEGGRGKLQARLTALKQIVKDL